MTDDPPVDTPHGQLAVGANDALLYLRQGPTGTWTLALPATDPMRVHRIIAASDGSILVQSQNGELYYREDLADPTRAWLQPPKDMSVFSIGSEQSKALLASNNDNGPWVPIDTSLPLLDVMVVHQGGAQRLLGIAERDNRIYFKNSPFEPWVIAFRPDDPGRFTEFAETPDEGQDNPPIVGTGLDGVKYVRASMDPDAPYTPATNPWNYYAVDLERYLCGAVRLSGPWVQLDRELQLSDVATMVDLNAENAEEPFIVGVGFNDQKIYIKETLTSPWRLALPENDAGRAMYVIVRDNGSILALGSDNRRYSRANLQEGTAWEPQFHEETVVVTTQVGRGPSARTISQNVTVSEQLKGIDESSNRFVAVGLDGLLYVTDGMKNAWQAFEEGQPSLPLLDVAIDKETEAVIGVGQDFHVIMKKEDSVNWSSMGSGSCCVRRVTSM
jgi:hypothetical protein